MVNGACFATGPARLLTRAVGISNARTHACTRAAAAEARAPGDTERRRGVCNTLAWRAAQCGPAQGASTVACAPLAAEARERVGLGRGRCRGRHDVTEYSTAPAPAGRASILSHGVRAMATAGPSAGLVPGGGLISAEVCRGARRPRGEVGVSRSLKLAYLVLS